MLCHSEGSWLCSFDRCCYSRTQNLNSPFSMSRCSVKIRTLHQILAGISFEVGLRLSVLI